MLIMELNKLFVFQQSYFHTLAGSIDYKFFSHATVFCPIIAGLFAGTRDT